MAGEGNWCTPPDSPSKARHGIISSSYEHAMEDNDWYWDWHHDLREEEECDGLLPEDFASKFRTTDLSSSLPVEIERSPPIDTHPRVQFHDQPPPHLRSSDELYRDKVRISQQDSGINSLGLPKDLDDIPNIAGNNILVAASSPTAIGFTPAYQTSYETTQISNLPGNRITRSSVGNSVVLSPPKSQGKAPRSIEEVGHNLSKYAPVNQGKNDMNLGESDVPFCFNYLTSFKDGNPKLKETVDGAAISVSGLLAKDEDLLTLEGTFSEVPSSSDHDEYVVNPYEHFTRSCTCYDMMPDSTKMVVLDRRLPVKKAFFALVQNGVRAAPVWNSSSQEFVGMLTISDFINILIFHYKSPIVEMDELEEQTIQMWRKSERQVADLKPTLIRIDPMESLYKAIQMLVKNKIHRLPVIDCRTGDAVYIMTHKRLIHFICLHLMDGPQPDFMQKPLMELGIGTYRNIATATRDTPLIVALNVFAERRISALPIVDKTGRVVDIYAKYDVINLAAERTYNNLDIPLHKALQHRAEGFEGVRTCQLSDTLIVIVRRIVTTQVHRLVVVDDDKHVIGVLSLSDLLSFLVLQPYSDFS